MKAMHRSGAMLERLVSIWADLQWHAAAGITALIRNASNKRPSGKAALHGGSLVPLVAIAGSVKISEQKNHNLGVRSVIFLAALTMPTLAQAVFPGAGTYSWLKIHTSHYIGGPSSAAVGGQAQIVASDPGITWQIQPGTAAGFYTITNVTAGLCLAIGDGAYEMGKGSNTTASSGYVLELSTCDYSDVHLQFRITDSGSNVLIGSDFDFYTTRYWCDDGSGPYLWFRGTCTGNGNQVTVGPMVTASAPLIFRKELF